MMKMDPKFVRRRRAVAIVIGSLLLSLFTYATGDLCWTGSGYGSCSAMIDEVISSGR
jgi:hypothetical protein